MLFTILSNSKCHQIVDLATVKAKNHIWINLFNLVLVVPNYIIEAAIGVDLALHWDALFDLIECLLDHAHSFIVFVVGGVRTWLISLLLRRWIVLVKVESLDRRLENLDNLLACVLFVFRAARSRLKIPFIYLLVNLRQIGVLALRDTDYLLITILREG